MYLSITGPGSLNSTSLCIVEFFICTFTSSCLNQFNFSLDSDEEITMTQYSKAPNVSVTQNSKVGFFFK